MHTARRDSPRLLSRVGDVFGMKLAHSLAVAATITISYFRLHGLKMESLADNNIVRVHDKTHNHSYRCMVQTFSLR